MNLIETLERDEGYREHLYIDTQGLLTIGSGRCLQSSPLTGDEWRLLFDNKEIAFTLSRSGARRLLERDVRAAREDCERSFFPWYQDLDEPRRDVLVMLAYNLGIQGLKDFRKMISALEAKDYETAAIELLDSRYSKQVGDRAKRLANQLRSGQRV